MAAKIFAFLALLSLSVSAATAYISPVSAAAATTIPLYSPQATIAATHPCVQYYAQLQTLASGILTPSAVLIQQPLAIIKQQCQAHLAVQSIMALQYQQVLVNPATTLLPNVFNQVALANPIAAAYLQQQQFLPNVFNQVAMTSPRTYWQQQQRLSNVNQVAFANPIAATYWQQQQLLPNMFNQVAMASPVTYWQQQQLLSNVFNQVALANPAAYLQQPFIGGAIF
ncbi:zein-alpha PZ22.1/22A1-like [Panicum miliaceum]|uniref:Zein-alpha PZ22.1/22A1-like n=1 Tax=Panicum miliaceum TaxID=4540 RepID=A0A3L6SDZ8_PANMI|nr:zein-alpha PZ22.1/22A1-like [Panicum miliaceum]